MTKDELLDALEDEREKFLEAIDGLSEDELQMPGVVGEWSIKDIMIHISAWEAELVKLLWQVKQGQEPGSASWTDQQVDQRNLEWYQAYHDRPLNRVIADFIAVRQQTSRRVEAFSENDLSDPNRFRWLEDDPFWVWIAKDSYEHEAEHTAQIHAWRTQLGK